MVSESLMEKVQVIVTGASGSIGSAAVLALAQRGYRVIMACRNVEKGEKIKAEIQNSLPEADLQVMQVDMASLKSVKSFADSLKDNGIQLGGIFNNAGTMNRNFALSEDGFEKTVAVNYIAPYFLTRSLLPLFQSDAHIVNMVSLTCGMAKLNRTFFEKTEKDFSQLGTYADSKLALLLFTVALSQKTEFHVNMADPGVVNSNMISLGCWFDPLADALFRPFCKSPEKGAIPAINALTTDVYGKYFVGKNYRNVNQKYMSNPKIEWLWETAEKLLFQKGLSF